MIWFGAVAAVAARDATNVPSRLSLIRESDVASRGAAIS